MVLNRDQIRMRGLIADGLVESSLRDCGYDLTISSLMGKNDQGEVTESINELDLEPQGIAVVVSRETLKLPADLCGHALVKTSLCREGVLAISIGVIDPKWEGPISSVLLNFGKKAYRLRKGDPFLRVTFHTLHQGSESLGDGPEPLVSAAPTAVELATVRAKYLDSTREKFESRLAGSFLDYTSLTWTAARRFFLPLLPAAAAITLVLALITFLLNFSVLVLASRAMPQDVVQAKAQVLTAEIKQDNQKLHDENSKLQEEVQELRVKLDEVARSRKKQ
jgi:deoxycytidine triphosphate deaminase